VGVQQVRRVRIIIVITRHLRRLEVFAAPARARARPSGGVARDFAGAAGG